MNINRILDKHFDGRTFEVYSMASDKALTKPASFNDTFNRMELMGQSSGASNGLDIREVK